MNRCLAPLNRVIHPLNNGGFGLPMETYFALSRNFSWEEGLRDKPKGPLPKTISFPELAFVLFSTKNADSGEVRFFEHAQSAHFQLSADQIWEP